MEKIISTRIANDELEKFRLNFSRRPGHGIAPLNVLLVPFVSFELQRGVRNLRICNASSIIVFFYIYN